MEVKSNQSVGVASGWPELLTSKPLPYEITMFLQSRKHFIQTNILIPPTNTTCTSNKSAPQVADIIWKHLKHHRDGDNLHCLSWNEWPDSLKHSASQGHTKWAGKLQAQNKPPIKTLLVADTSTVSNKIMEQLFPTYRWCEKAVVVLYLCCDHNDSNCSQEKQEKTNITLWGGGRTSKYVIT